MSEPRTENRQEQTPWGLSDTVTHYMPGLDFLSTPGHGGFRLSQRLWDVLLEAFPSFQSFAGPGWLEEDEDANLAILRWPDLFTSQSVFFAVRYVRQTSNPRFDEAKERLNDGQHRAAEAIAEDFAKSIALCWERGSLWTAANGWMVSMMRGGVRRLAYFADYPLKHFYTDEEAAPLFAAAVSTEELYERAVRALTWNWPSTKPQTKE